MSSLGIGLIGCGRIAQWVHLNALASLPDVELVAIADLDPERRKEAKRRATKAIAFAHYQELLEKTEAEAVVICLPPALHAEAVIAALQQGKHVYLEKPLATNLDDANRILRAWRQSGKVGMIGFNYRFNPLYRAVKHHIQSGRLGELVSVRTVFSSPQPEMPAWKQARKTGGGVLLDLASHHIDLLRFLFENEICEVFAEARSQYTEGDSVILQCRLANGLPIQSFFSICTVEEDRIEIYGRQAKLSVDRHHSVKVEITEAVSSHSRFKRLRHGLRSLAFSPALMESLTAPGREPSYQAALLQFVMAARTGQAVSPDLYDGYRSLAVVEAAEVSTREGKVVLVSDMDKP